MKKLFSILLSVVLVIGVVNLCGCKSEGKGTNSNNTSTVQTTTTTVSGNLSNNILDYKIQNDKDLPLKITTISNKTFKEIYDGVLVSRGISDVDHQFMISYFKSMFLCDIDELRKIHIDDEDLYYCIFMNKKGKKQYAFFSTISTDPKYKDEWCCFYSTTNLNSKDMKESNLYVYDIDK